MISPRQIMTEGNTHIIERTMRINLCIDEDYSEMRNEGTVFWKYGVYSAPTKDEGKVRSQPRDSLV